MTDLFELCRSVSEEDLCNTVGLSLHSYLQFLPAMGEQTMYLSRSTVLLTIYLSGRGTVLLDPILVL